MNTYCNSGPTISVIASRSPLSGTAGTLTTLDPTNTKLLARLQCAECTHTLAALGNSGLAVLGGLNLSLFDLNGDDFFDAADVALIGNPGSGNIADLNRDGFVDGLDLGILLGAWDPEVAAAMGISGGAAVPEPSGLVLLCLGLGLISRRSR